MQPGNDKLQLKEDEWATKKALYKEKKVEARRAKLAEKKAQLDELRLAAENNKSEAVTRQEEFQESIRKQEEKRENAAAYASDIERWKRGG